MDEIPQSAEHESIATSLEVEQLDKNLWAWWSLEMLGIERSLDFGQRPYIYPKVLEAYLVARSLFMNTMSLVKSDILAQRSSLKLLLLLQTV